MSIGVKFFVFIVTLGLILSTYGLILAVEGVI